MGKTQDSCYKSEQLLQIGAQQSIIKQILNNLKEQKKEERKNYVRKNRNGGSGTTKIYAFINKISFSGNFVLILQLRRDTVATSLMKCKILFEKPPRANFVIIGFFETDLYLFSSDIIAKLLSVRKRQREME